jgi:hypothetical protein
MWSVISTVSSIVSQPHSPFHFGSFLVESDGIAAEDEHDGDDDLGPAGGVCSL